MASYTKSDGAYRCVCGKEACYRCTRCKSAWYCGVECQRLDWEPRHRGVCNCVHMFEAQKGGRRGRQTVGDIYNEPAVEITDEVATQWLYHTDNAGVAVERAPRDMVKHDAASILRLCEVANVEQAEVEYEVLKEKVEKKKISEGEAIESIAGIMSRNFPDGVLDEKNVAGYTNALKSMRVPGMIADNGGAGEKPTWKEWFKDLVRRIGTYVVKLLDRFYETIVVAKNVVQMTIDKVGELVSATVNGAYRIESEELKRNAARVCVFSLLAIASVPNIVVDAANTALGFGAWDEVTAMTRVCFEAFVGALRGVCDSKIRKVFAGSALSRVISIASEYVDTAVTKLGVFFDAAARVIESVLAFVMRCQTWVMKLVGIIAEKCWSWFSNLTEEKTSASGNGADGARIKFVVAGAQYANSVRDRAKAYERLFMGTVGADAAEEIGGKIELLRDMAMRVDKVTLQLTGPRDVDKQRDRPQLSALWSAACGVVDTIVMHRDVHDLEHIDGFVRMTGTRLVRLAELHELKEVRDRVDATCREIEAAVIHEWTTGDGPIIRDEAEYEYTGASAAIPKIEGDVNVVLESNYAEFKEECLRDRNVEGAYLFVGDALFNFTKKTPPPPSLNHVIADRAIVYSHVLRDISAYTAKYGSAVTVSAVKYIAKLVVECNRANKNDELVKQFEIVSRHAMDVDHYSKPHDVFKDVVSPAVGWVTRKSIAPAFAVFVAGALSAVMRFFFMNLPTKQQVMDRESEILIKNATDTLNFDVAEYNGDSCVVRAVRDDGYRFLGFEEDCNADGSHAGVQMIRSLFVDKAIKERTSLKDRVISLVYRCADDMLGLFDISVDDDALAYLDKYTRDICKTIKEDSVLAATVKSAPTVPNEDLGNVLMGVLLPWSVDLSMKWISIASTVAMLVVHFFIEYKKGRGRASFGDILGRVFSKYVASQAVKAFATLLIYKIRIFGTMKRAFIPLDPIFDAAILLTCLWGVNSTISFTTAKKKKG